jgi:membrane protein required for colicin V production
MSWADLVIAAVILLSAVLAAAQGFFFEIFSLAGVVVGYLFAAWGYHRAAPWFSPYVSSPWVANFAAFLTIFLVVVLLAGIVGRVVRWTMKEAGMRWFDRVLGAAFGLVRGVLVVMVFALALASFAPESPLLANSRTAPYLLVVARAAVWLAPSEVRMQFRAGIDALGGLKHGKPATPDNANRTAVPPATGK